MHVDSGMLAALQEPMALDNPEIAQLIPPIIEHAIYLTSVMGEIYLWADALCVPHHNPKITQQELKMMGAIYASAVVTIVATDGDASVGLLGLRGVSSPRKLKQKIFPFGNDQILVRNTSVRTMKVGNPYYERGWTYQEYMMSPRRIIFNRQEIHWECSCSTWHEELVHGAVADLNFKSKLNLNLTGFPVLGGLSDIIGNYNTKTLRHEEDALPENRLSPAGLPSWSWIGWQGDVSFGLGEAMIFDKTNYGVEETMPIIKWYPGPSPGTSPAGRQRIRSTWFENRDTYKDAARPLPPGWTRHDAGSIKPWGDEPLDYLDGCDRSFYKHDATTSSRIMWHYPFPVAEINDTTLPSMPEQTEYLFCDTIKVSLWGYQAGYGNFAKLVNSEKELVGSLKLHNKDFLEQFPSSPSQEVLGLQVDLVAIYKSRVYRRNWNEEGRYGHSPPKYDVYVVLWVKWIDGVAYRLACGEVVADAWEDLPRENVSLVLG
ncbi:hypothetical protein PspLS_11984 [Pyricularia sp. CBS 133598]|nr:hypothetical protein PspLS_11984 [Pyricularia sp. CBS 133598]